MSPIPGFGIGDNGREPRIPGFGILDTLHTLDALCIMHCLLTVSAIRVRQKMCGKRRPFLMIGDLLCENVCIHH